MTPEWPQALNCQKLNVYIEYSPPMPKFQSVSLYDQPFLSYKLVENRKCTTKWPHNDLKNITVKSILYTVLYTEYSSPRTKFHSVSLYDQLFSS